MFVVERMRLDLGVVEERSRGLKEGGQTQILRR